MPPALKYALVIIGVYIGALAFAAVLVALGRRRSRRAAAGPAPSGETTGARPENYLA